jgi:hypothetical protein
MIIYKSLLKYSYSKFKLEILEFFEKENVINKEQYYIDLFKPEYSVKNQDQVLAINILKKL